MPKIKVTVLGCGTSTGVPVPGCDCKVCRSDNPRNKRLRCSILVELLDAINDTNSDEKRNAFVLVDTSTDLRAQALRVNLKHVDAVLYTHAHADHIFGIDDLRCFNFARSRANRESKPQPIPLYASETTANELERVFSYAFHPDESYQGGALPQLSLNRLTPQTPFKLFGHVFHPLRLEHGPTEVFGYRVGSFAYLTDCSNIPDEARGHLTGLKYLIIDGLRERPHNTHFNFAAAAKEVELLKPEHSFLIHTSHDADYDEANRQLAALSSQRIELAYDGLVLTL